MPLFERLETLEKVAIVRVARRMEQSVPKFFSTYTGQADPILPGQLFSMTVCN
jgi:hypothetical protein